MSERIGIIDLGTNTFHLLLAEIQGGNMKIIHRERQAVRIGMGGINQHIIQEEALERALQCLRLFQKTIVQKKANRVLALATSALRSANNAKEVIRKIKKETGIEVTIISGEQEAHYIYLGIQSALDLGIEKSLIVDIGGGSVEFIICNREEIFWKQSIDIGAQRLLERYHKHDPILAEEIEQLTTHYQQALISLHVAIGTHQPITLVGSSGTFDTLSEIYCEQSGIPFHREKQENPLTVKAFLKIHHELIIKNRAERLSIPGMIEMRVDMIVVASCLIHYLVTHFTFRKIRVSSYSLKEGVLSSLAK